MSGAESTTDTRPAPPEVPLESCTSGSALLEEIDELPRGRSSYIAANWLVGHALL
jgi:hypothetical protein